MKIHIVMLLKTARKWIRRLVISYMLGFASAMDQDTKSIDDTFFKIEQTIPDEKA